MSEEESVEVLIIGGGVCGVLAGQRCAAKGLSFRLVDEGNDFGGTWRSLANTHSQLQACEVLYRWDSSYPLGKALAKLSAGTVVGKLRSYALARGLYERATFSRTVTTVRFETQTDRYIATVKDLCSGKLSTISAAYLFVACGLLDKQYSPQGRGLPSLGDYRGFYTLAGRADSRDSLVSSSDLLNKDVVIIGSGAFACEAMEAAARAGAAKITLVSREHKRWILPFSRQFTVTALTYVPLVPWRLKMAVVQLYLRTCFYSPARLSHVAPAEATNDMDYTGQCNDAIFQLSRSGVVSVLVDSVAGFARDGVHLRSGLYLRADMVVMAAGCKYLSQPPFLQTLGLGHDQLYNYAFLGPTGRIGTASDVVYAFVPVGPKKQLDMFFHGIECLQHGMGPAFRAALRQTPLSTDRKESAGATDAVSPSYTWFHARHWYSSLNSSMEARNAAYLRTMSVGLSWWRAVQLSMSLQLITLLFWLASCVLSCIELAKLPVL